MSQEVLEITYTISFYPKLNSIPRTKRAQKAMSMLREFIQRHRGGEEIWIAQEVNEEIFKRGMQKPPRKITVRTVKQDDDVIEVYLAGVTPEEYFKPEPTQVSVQPSEEEIDLEEEDFEEDEE